MQQPVPSTYVHRRRYRARSMLHDGGDGGEREDEDGDDVSAESLDDPRTGKLSV